MSLKTSSVLSILLFVVAVRLQAADPQLVLKNDDSRYRLVLVHEPGWFVVHAEPQAPAQGDAPPPPISDVHLMTSDERKVPPETQETVTFTWAGSSGATMSSAGEVVGFSLERMPERPFSVVASDGSMDLTWKVDEKTWAKLQK